MLENELRLQLATDQLALAAGSDGVTEQELSFLFDSYFSYAYDNDLEIGDLQ